jgi:PAS domain S-box-containing protein
VKQSVVVTDLQGRVVYWNPFAEQMYGWSAEEALGRTTIELISHEESKGHGEEIMARLRAGQTWAGEYLARRRDGTAFPIHTNCGPIFDEAGNLTHVIGVSEDITQQKDTERRRRESEERFRQIAATIPGVIYQFRLKTNGEFDFPFMSPGARDIFGVSPEQAAADIAAVMATVHPEDISTLESQLSISAENLSPYNIVHRVIPRPGEVRWIKAASIPAMLDDGAIVWNGVVIDITEQMEAEEKLRKSRERFKLAMEASRDGLWDWDIRSDEVFTSPAYAAMLGYGPGEIPGEIDSIMELIHPEDREDVIRASSDCIENRRETFALECRMKAWDGSWRWILGRGKAVARDETGRATRLVGTHTDITERKSAEEEKTRLEAQVHQTQKMESIGRLAGGVAHDLNNLLSPILGYTEMLIMETREDDPAAGILEQIEKAGMRARDLVRQLLTFSRKQPLKFETLNLNRLLQNFEKLLRRALREDIALEMRLSFSPTFVRGDVGQLEQVIMNLVVNAQDAMPEGGLLRIETECAESDEAVPSDAGSEKKEGAVRLWVRDTGFGMNPETRARLFEPFFTTKAVGKGTGLGMATVYGIVQQHGGTIQVESEIDAGTAFRIDLPVAAGSPEPSVPRPRLHSAPDFRGRETILVAEDEPAVRDLIRQILTNQGYAVIVNAGGTEALAALKRHEGPVHLLLTDVVMPDMSGLQLFRRVSELRAETRVLYMSGYADEAIARHGVIMEEVNFIQKPFNVKNLAAKIREVLDGERETE